MFYGLTMKQVWKLYATRLIQLVKKDKKGERVDSKEHQIQ